MVRQNIQGMEFFIGLGEVNEALETGRGAAAAIVVKKGERSAWTHGLET